MENVAQVITTLRKFATQYRETILAALSPRTLSVNEINPQQILKLPDEILTVIMRLLILPHDRSANAWSKNEWGLTKTGERRDLSLVCQRFHSLVNHTSDFWTDITSTQPQHILKQHLVRSKMAPLHISIMICCKQRTPLDVPSSDVRHRFSLRAFHAFIETIVDHSHRWKSFALRGGVIANYEILTSAISMIRLWTTDIHLPSLQDIYADFYGSSIVHDIEYAEHVEFFASWKTPVLKSFYLQNHTFFHGLENAKKGTISTYGHKVIRMDETISFIAQHPQLECLSCIGFATMVGSSFETVIMPNLRELKMLRIQNAHYLEPFFARMQLPELQTLFLDIPWFGVPNVTSAENVLSNCFKRLNCCAFLTTLTVNVHHGIDPDTSIMDIVFRHLQNLEHLTIQDPNGPLPTSTQAFHGIWRLRTLKIVNSANYTSKFVDYIINALRTRSKEAIVQRLQSVTLNCSAFRMHINAANQVRNKFYFLLASDTDDAYSFCIVFSTSSKQNK